MTLMEKKKKKQLWNTLMIIAHIVTEPLCKILCKKPLFSKGRFFRRHCQKIQELPQKSAT